MDAFEMKEQNQPTRKVSSLIWNVLTVLVLLMVVCLAAFFLMILAFSSSDSALAASFGRPRCDIKINMPPRSRT